MRADGSVVNPGQVGDMKRLFEQKEAKIRQEVEREHSLPPHSLARASERRETGTVLQRMIDSDKAFSTMNILESPQPAIIGVSPPPPGDMPPHPPPIDGMPPLSKSFPSRVASRPFTPKYFPNQTVILRSGEMGKVLRYEGSNVFLELIDDPANIKKMPEDVLRLTELSPEQLQVNAVFDSFIEKTRSCPTLSLQEAMGDITNLEYPDFREMAELFSRTTSLTGKSGIKEMVIDKLFSLLPWTGPVSATVYTEEREGKGDLATALKVTAMLRKLFNHGQSAIELVSDKKSRSIIGNMGNSYGIAPIQLPVSVDTSLTDRFPETDVRPDVFIQAPAMSTFNTLMELRSAANFAPPGQVPRIGLEECTKHSVSDAQSLGLDPTELGILVDQDLHAYKTALDAISVGQRKLYKLNSYMRLIEKPQILAALLSRKGQDAHNLMSEIRETAVPGLEVGAERIAEYADHNKLYFGYTNRSGSQFFRSVVHMEAESTENIDIVHPGGSYLKYVPQLLLDLESQTFREELMQAGVGKIEIVEFNDDGIAKNPTIISCGEGKTIRFILPSRLLPSEMSAFWKMSEDVVACTGNNSAFEAISAGKTIFYECLTFKQNQDFMDEIFTQAQSVTEDANMGQLGVMTRAMSGDIISGTRLDTTSILDTDASLYRDFAGMLKNDNVQQHFKRFSDYVSEQMNFSDRMAGQVIGSLISKQSQPISELVIAFKAKAEITQNDCRELFENIKRELMPDMHADGS
jgi:hypothetical protein